MNQRTRTVLAEYGVAVVAVVVATGLRLLLDPLLGDKFPFATLFLAVLVAAWWGGYGPALLATALGAVASARFLVPPRDGFAVEGFDDQAGLALYLAVGVGLALLGGRMRSARRRAEAAAQETSLRREQLRVTLGSIGDAVVATDATGRVTFLNPVAQALTGWADAEAVGRDLGAVFDVRHEETGGPV